MEGPYDRTIIDPMRLHLKPVTPPKPFAATVCEVAETVPQNAVVRNRPNPH
jgi:hypothetical protein